MYRSSLLVALVLPLGVAAAADSTVAVDFVDLRGVLNLEPGGRGGTFTAGAVNDSELMSNGLVWRSLEPAGEALFDTGFVSEPNPADAIVNLNFGEVHDKLAEMFGTAAFTDVDGDTVIFQLMGTMSFGPGGQVVTNAAISGIEVRSDEGSFDGTDGGSVSTMGFEEARGSFTINFSYQLRPTGEGRTRIGTASLSGDAGGPRGVPTPGTGVILAAAALAAARRRRPQTGRDTW